MGKNKTAQRTKGNVKPSSSSRSAELNGGTGGFIGFSSVSGLGYVPAASQLEDECEVATEFRITLRKLEKKDSTTKLKALQEFLGLCESQNIDSLKTVLPFWPRLFSKLCLDCNEMVREDVQLAHHSLVNHTKKLFRPYLKSIMPFWLLVMADPNPCVTTRAKRSFEETFTIQKRPDVMTYCAEEIVKFFSDNILVQTAQTLGDGYSSPEEIDSKCTRVVCCSLKALGLFLKLSKPAITSDPEVEQSINTILKADKFWAYSKHKNPLIKAAWFDFLSCLIEYFDSMDPEFLPILSKNILSSINCPEANVLPHVWRSMIVLCAKSPNCWEHCSKTGSVLSNILNVLRDGGRGCAIELYPLMKPLLKLLPIDLLKDGIFYANFFKAISTSLRKTEIVVVREEGRAIICAMFQCISLLHKEAVLTPDQWQSIITYQIIGHLKSTWEEQSLLTDSCFYRETAFLLTEWSETDSSSDKLSTFWKLFLPECNLVLESNDRQQIFCLIKLYETLAGKKTKTRKFVEFSVAPSSQSEVVPAHFIRHVSLNVAPLVKRAYDAFLTGSNNCFDLFCCLITTFPSPEAYSMILGKPSENVDLAFAQSIVLPMLNKGSNFPVDDSVKIFLHGYKSLCDASRDTLLFGLKSTVSTKAIAALIKSLHKLASSDAVASSWLQSAPLGSRVVREMEEIFALLPVVGSVDQVLAEKNDALTLVRFILNNSRASDYVICAEYLDQILQVMRVMLAQNRNRDEGGKSAWNTVHLSVSLLESVQPTSACWRQPEATEVFCLLIDHHLWTAPCLVEDGRRHELLSTFVRNAFHSCALFDLKCHLDSRFLSRFIDTVTRVIYAPETPFAVVVTGSEIVCDFFRGLFRRCDRTHECDIMLDHDRIRDLFRMLMPDAERFGALERTLVAEYVTPELCSRAIMFADFPYGARYAAACDHFDSIYPRVCLFLTEVLIALISDFESQSATTGVSLGEYTALCVQLLHGECYMSEMTSLLIKTTKNNISEDLEYGTNMLHRKIGELMQLVNEGSKKHMVKLFRNRCTTDEYLWPVTFMKCLDSWLRIDINGSKLFTEAPTATVNTTALLQIIAPYLTDEQRAEKLCALVLRLKNSEHFAVPVSLLIEASCLFQSLAAFWASAMVKDMFQILRNNKKHNESAPVHRVTELPFSICLTRLLSSLITHHKDRFSHADWDFSLCHLSATLTSLNVAAMTSEESYGMGLLICAISDFALVVFRAMGEVSQNKDVYPVDLLDEWNLVYSQAIYKALFSLLIECSEYYRKHNLCYMLYEACSAVSKCLHDTPVHRLLEMDEAHVTAPEPEGKAEFNHKLLKCLRDSIPLLNSAHLPLQLIAHSLLQKIRPAIVIQWDNAVTDQKDFDIPELATICIAIIGDAERQIISFVNARTSEEKNLQIRLVPHTAEFCCWTRYLIAFQLVFSICKTCSERNKQQLVSYLGKTSHLHTLLYNLLFVILPFAPKDDHKDKMVEDYFSEEFDSSVNELNEHTLSRLAARNYLHCLSLMPAETRYWFKKQEKTSQQSVEKLTRVYVSPIVISNEFRLINEAGDKFENISIKTKEKLREVIATYVLDDTKLDLVLNISAVHPLSHVTLDHAMVGVATTKWRGLSTMLMYGNTTLLNALLFWKKNVDQRFEGVEECFICYSILQTNTKQVPKLSCRTCKNKFHSACLYKWFDTANKTTCPICRSPF